MYRLYIDKMIIDNNDLLGPSPRVLLWLHGCNRKCPGCIAADWNHALSAQCSLSVKTIAQMVEKNNELEGITISGGEPFLQAGPLSRLVCSITKGIIVYTGYTKHELENMNSQFNNYILNNIDVLIDGEYVEELDDDQPFRGSSNQKIYFLTDRYNSYYNSYSERKTHVERKDGFLYIYGIPDKQDRTEWLRLKSGIEQRRNDSDNASIQE